MTVVIYATVPLIYNIVDKINILPTPTTRDIGIDLNFAAIGISIINASTFGFDRLMNRASSLKNTSFAINALSIATGTNFKASFNQFGISLPAKRRSGSTLGA